MDEMPLKEKAVLAVIGVVVMYALVVALWFLRQEGAWKRARKQYNTAVAKYEGECRLIGEKRKWTEAYEEEKAQMPTFAEGDSSDMTWLPKLEELTKRHYLTVTQRQAGKEVSAGEVLELPIEVKNWEGALESLVRFMHDVENSNEGMFDIRALAFKPMPAKKGYLRGSFTLTCAYMRE